MSMPGGSEWILIIMSLCIFILPIVALIDIVKGTFKDPNNKLVWILLVIFLPFIGSILYFTIGKKQKINA